MKTKISLFVISFLSFILEFIMFQNNFVIVPMLFLNILIIFYFLNVTHFVKYIKFDILRLIINPYTLIIFFIFLLENTFSSPFYHYISILIIFIIIISLMDFITPSINIIYISFLIIVFGIYNILIYIGPSLFIKNMYISFSINDISIIIFNICINIIVNILMLKIFSKSLIIKD